jgi:hypothetical protein
MRTYRLAALLGLGLVLGACGEFDAPDQNSGTLNDLESGTPSRAAVNTATQGLLAGVRGSNSSLLLGIFGREAYSLDVSNPQNIPQFYTVATPGLGAYWTGAYGNMKQANVIMKALDNVVGMTDAEKEGVRGFAKTIKAYLLFEVIRETDTRGAALEALDKATDPPPDVVGKDAVYTQILKLLDEAQTHLQAAGSSFPFTMTTGFANFNTPAKFLQFNRAVRAKVNLTWAKYAAVLTDVQGSFLDPDKDLQYGAYNTYSTNAGDALNPRYDPTARQRYAHGSFAKDAKLQAGATPGDTTKRDLRFLSKIYNLKQFVRYGFTVNWAFKRYNSNTDPIPVIKNEELILIRAEANIATGGTSGADPLDDINLVRTTSGGLPPLRGGTWAGLTPTQQRDTLLYEKRYSLMYENGDRWVDLRRYGLLPRLPQDRAGDLVWRELRIPNNECVPRGTKPPGCAPLTGITPGVLPPAP